MKRTTTIFRQLIYNVIAPSLAALIILGIINYQHTKNIMVEANDNKNKIIADEIKSVLEFQDMAFDILDNGLGQRMKGYSNLLTSMYFSNTSNIEKVNLSQIRDEIGMDPSMEDIYIINRNGVIVNTTFAKDKGLNLFSFGETHKKYLLDVLSGGKFVNERFAIEATTKRLKKYTYEPTADKKYIIEIGFYSKDADKIINFIRRTLYDLSQRQKNIKSVDLFILTDKPFSLNDNAVITPAHQPLLDKVFKEKSTISVVEEENNRKIEYTYIYMQRKKSALYKGSAIQIITDRTDEISMLRFELFKLIGIFGFAIILVIILIYRKTKVITNPIKNLVENINRITHGHLHERAEVIGNNEITTLSQQFNRMIEELESYYNELEQKVRDRTAEIMQQKEEIEAQRDAIEQQRNMLAEINESLEHAYEEISEQKKHITDSIIYAKRIQTAILPPDEIVEKLLPDSFILYKPKDIVSGDFYWLSEKNGLVMVAAVDCTGHGVPGAFMSIVGHNNLNFSVNVKGARHAGDILNELNQAVTDTLRQQRGHETIRDGMDIALCCFDFNAKRLDYAGANNPLVIIRNGETISVDPTKAPIGAFVGDRLTSFKNNDIEFQPNDMCYIFSDGYADQFGGPDNKKFLKRKLKELLAEISAEPVSKQKEMLDHAFELWRGDNEQVDDILIIGIRCH
jgi:serine phosphatase RsbU (regulator of sigma subunit)